MLRAAINARGRLVSSALLESGTLFGADDRQQPLKYGNFSRGCSEAITAQARATTKGVSKVNICIRASRWISAPD
jgi:hypothetical protein